MDPQDPQSWRRRSEPGNPVPRATRARSRDHGIRQVRRLSNWTAVALVAATAATAGYFARAHPAIQQSAPVTGSHSTVPRTSSGAPCITVPVAVSGGSGVTTPSPAPSCVPGTGGQTGPTVVYVKQGEDRGD
jgi:hypothetical protein